MAPVTTLKITVRPRRTWIESSTFQQDLDRMLESLATKIYSAYNVDTAIGADLDALASQCGLYRHYTGEPDSQLRARAKAFFARGRR